MLNHHTENHLFRGEGQLPISVELSSQPADARPPTEKILLQLVVGEWTKGGSGPSKTIAPTGLNQAGKVAEPSQ